MELDTRTWHLSSARIKAARSNERNCKGVGRMSARAVVTKMDDSSDASVRFRGGGKGRGCFGAMR